MKHIERSRGLTSPQKLGSPVGKVGKLGKVSIQIPYSLDPYSGLPGCRWGSTATVLVTIIATDQSGDKASTEIYLKGIAVCPGERARLEVLTLGPTLHHRFER